MYVTTQLAAPLFPPPAMRVHVVGVKAPTPLGLTLQLTEPVGMILPLPLSVTVTVQLTEVPTVSVLDTQVTFVVVLRATNSV